MYRKPSGGTGFSFGRLVTNAFPNFANDNSEQDADLTATEQDGLWMHQVVGADACGRPPMTLDAESALRAGVTSKSAFKVRILLHRGPTFSSCFPAFCVLRLLRSAPSGNQLLYSLKIVSRGTRYLQA